MPGAARLFQWEVLSTSTPMAALIRQLNRRLGELARTLGGGRGVTPQVPDTTPTTLFTVPVQVKGLYTVVAMIPGAGADNIATAQVVSDGTQLFTVDGYSGLNLDLSALGGAVRVTQTTGAPKDVSWSYTVS
jgi:hypothetical protein